jgi:hydroxyacylglutathione hydrolase
MRIELGLHVVMSGGGGFDLTDVLDCNAFLIDGSNG